MIIFSHNFLEVFEFDGGENQLEIDQDIVLIVRKFRKQLSSRFGVLFGDKQILAKFALDFAAQGTEIVFKVAEGFLFDRINVS